jgi:hypothetical protein
MSLPDQSSQMDCPGSGIEFELKIPLLVNLFKVVLPTSTHSVGTRQATRAPHVIAFTGGDRVSIREGTSKSCTKCRIGRRPEQKAPQVRSHPASMRTDTVPRYRCPYCLIWKSISLGEVHFMRADIVPGAARATQYLSDVGAWCEYRGLRGDDLVVLLRGCRKFRVYEPYEEA